MDPQCNAVRVSQRGPGPAVLSAERGRHRRQRGSSNRSRHAASRGGEAAAGDDVGVPGDDLDGLLEERGDGGGRDAEPDERKMHKKALIVFP